ncbi:MAG: hypothetical protein IJO92_02890 [Clostridia bacterium]|nr:hypothetical protein [Clostridia bacterium]
MASLNRTLPNRNFDEVLRRIEDGIIDGSISASLEESCDYNTPSARCAVRVFERYSYAGGNRVSLSVTLFESAGELHLFAAATGGSQAMFWKVNTFGEEAFLDKLKELL